MTKIKVSTVLNSVNDGITKFEGIGILKDKKIIFFENNESCRSRPVWCRFGHKKRIEVNGCKWNLENIRAAPARAGNGPLCRNRAVTVYAQRR